MIKRYDDKDFSSGNIRRKGMVTFKVYVIDLFGRIL